MKKVLLSIFIVILVFSIFPIQVSAISGDIEAGDDFIKSGTSDTTFNPDNLKAMSKFLYEVFLTIGIIVSVIVAAILRNSVYDRKHVRKSESKRKLSSICSRMYYNFRSFRNMENDS